MNSWGNQIAQPPPSHGVKFRKAIDDKSPIGKLQDRMLLALIDQAMVDFIGDDVRRKLSDLFIPLWGHDHFQLDWKEN